MNAALRAPSREHVDTRRGGFSLVELLMVVTIVGLLAGLAIPNFRSVTYRARAADIAGDLEVVRVAALNYNAEALTWPDDAALGSVPSELDGYLPEGFSFQGSGYQLKLENLVFPGGLPGDPSTTRLIAVSVSVDMDELSNAVVDFLGGAIVFSVGSTHTVVIDRS